MFSKIFASSAVVLALAFQVNAHTTVIPMMGVASPTRDDIVRITDAAAPCGLQNPATAMATAQVAMADANGQFSGTIQNFNRCAFFSLLEFVILLKMCRPTGGLTDHARWWPWLTPQVLERTGHQ